MEGATSQLTKKERREIKRQEKEAGRMARERAKKSGRIMRLAAVFIILTAIVGGVILLGRNVKISEESLNDVTKMCVQHGGGLGIHIHPHLTITIKGEEQEIPANIGIPSPQCMRPLHTHDATGTLHLEFPKSRDVKLGEFFKIWEKQFSSACILEFCNGPDGNVKMTVNDNENLEFENYIMKDQDNINITYE